MYCEHPITYAVKSGDNLFLLAKRFKTTVQMILFLNPGINPYNLQIGSNLIICPSEDYMPDVAFDADNTVPNRHLNAQHIDENDASRIDVGRYSEEFIAADLSGQPDKGSNAQDTVGTRRVEEDCKFKKNCPPLPEIKKTKQPNAQDLSMQKSNEFLTVSALSAQSNCQKMMDLINEMRLAFSQHIYWTRMAIISITEKLDDKNDTVNRLMQNAYDVAKVFAEYFPLEKASEIEGLISEHLDLGGRLVTALTDGQMEEANDLNRRWYQNAESLAATFASLTPHLNKDRLTDILFMHLEMITRMTAYRLGGSFKDDISEFNGMEKEILVLADYLSNGIIQEFSDRF